MGKAEFYVEGYLLKQTHRHDGMCMKFVSPGRRGAPDRIVIHAGRVVFVETKALKGVPSAIQKVRHREMRAAGADVRVINTREQVDALIVELMTERTPDIYPDNAPLVDMRPRH
jgi:hypothetical protein